MARDSSGSHNEPIYLGSGAPATAADQNEIVTFAKKLANGYADTNSVRTALAGADLWDGLLFYETDTDRTYQRKSAGWVLIATGWESYTPTTANITGSITAFYKLTGKSVEVRIVATLSAAMTNQPSFSLPLTASDSSIEYLNGSCLLQDTGTTEYPGIVRKSNSTTIGPFCLNAAGSFVNFANVGVSNFPFTWASGDIIQMNFIYRIA